jgi:hypothetical protein
MKNNKYRLYSAIEIIILIFLIIFEMFSIQNAGKGFQSDIGDEVRREILRLVMVIMTAGVGIFLCFHLSRKAKYQEIKDDNNRLHAIVDAECSLIFEYNSEDDIFVWYSKTDKFYNVPCQKEAFEKCVNPDDWPILLQQLEDAKRRKTYTIPIRLTDASGNGSEHLYNCRTIAGSNTPGRVKKVIGVICENSNTVFSHY